jgi:hypothetical protein
MVATRTGSGMRPTRHTTEATNRRKWFREEAFDRLHKWVQHQHERKTSHCHEKTFHGARLNASTQDAWPARQRRCMHKELSQSVNRLSKGKLSVDFHPELLKAWLTLRSNPSTNCFLAGRGSKSNTSRMLLAEELRVDKFKGSAEKAAGELQTILYDMVRSTAASIPKGERIGVLSSGGASTRQRSWRFSAGLAIVLRPSA